MTVVARPTSPAAPVRQTAGSAGWYVDALLALVAWIGFAEMVVLHAVDLRRDFAQEALRRRDLVRFAGHTDLQGLARAAQAFGMAWFLVLIALLVVIVLLVYGQRRRAWLLVAVTVVVTLTVTVIKLSIRHPVAQQVAGLRLGSFPSGHTADVTAIVGTVLVVLTPIRLRLLPYVVAISGGLVVGGTRVISGAHTPDDVVAGWLLGSALVLSAGAWLAALAQR